MSDISFLEATFSGHNREPLREFVNPIGTNGRRLVIRGTAPRIGGTATFHFPIRHRSRPFQPHFLFNTLHAISSLMHRDLNAANEMLAQLGDFLRVTLERSEVQEISLRDELEVLERYLSIMRIRFGDRLTVSHEIDPRVLDTSVPQLVLQPLVENAIKHGVARHAGPARVCIKAGPVGEAVEISVVDDGPGLSAGRVQEGMGLTNTRKRLEQLYGSAGQLTLRSLPRGLEVAVRVPRQSEQSTGLLNSTER